MTTYAAIKVYKYGVDSVGRVWALERIDGKLSRALVVNDERIIPHMLAIDWLRAKLEREPALWGKIAKENAAWLEKQLATRRGQNDAGDAEEGDKPVEKL